MIPLTRFCVVAVSVSAGEEVNQTFLAAFYNDTKRYGFAFQMFMLSSRLYQIDEASRQAKDENRSATLRVFFSLPMISRCGFSLTIHNTTNSRPSPVPYSHALLFFGDFRPLHSLTDSCSWIEAQSETPSSHSRITRSGTWIPWTWMCIVPSVVRSSRRLSRRRSIS